MSETSERFLSAVALAEVEARVFDVAFEATPQYVPWPKAYGGDMVAQTMAAAAATVEDDRMVHSTHGYFLRPVNAGEVVRYEVEVLRDGRGYSTRTVRGFQNDKAVFAAILSFHVGAESPEHQLEMPSIVAPEELPSSAEYLRGEGGAAAEYWSHGRSFDMRHASDPVYTSNDGAAEPRQAVWIRSFDQLSDDPRLHQVALAYVCDYTILEPALRALGVNWSAPGLMTASLDHSMWFHRPLRVDDWLLYTQEAASVSSGRGLAHGRFYDRGGRLVASVAQEGLISLP